MRNDEGNVLYTHTTATHFRKQKYKTQLYRYMSSKDITTASRCEREIKRQSAVEATTTEITATHIVHLGERRLLQTRRVQPDDIFTR